MTTLPQRVIKCKHWRWMPGMLVRYSDGKSWYRLTEIDSYGIRPTNYKPPNPRDAWPDLNDPATIGCLLALVRDSWQGQFTVCGEDQLAPEALVKALEVAE